MRVAVQIGGLNLERLLRIAPQAGITLGSVRRVEGRALQCSVPLWQLGALRGLCARSGWTLCEVRADAGVRLVHLARSRVSLLLGMALCVSLVALSSRMILAVRIENAQESVAEVRRFLAEERVQPGRLKAAFSLDDLRARMAVRLPGLSFAGMRYAGSTLIVDCRPAREGEAALTAGEGIDIVALEPGIVTRIAVSSGTPAVEVGQAVRKGQVLIRGQERVQQGGTRTVRAEGQVTARVWARGDARVRLSREVTTETGRIRRRTTLASPWHRTVVRDAQPFASQDMSREVQRVVGLYLPLWREIETYAETIVTTVPRDQAEARAAAQGAAEEMAKGQCPVGALILDKWVEFRVEDGSCVDATVILEYEASIAGRIN
ncbi:MAG: sporulation protein YqfD [Candidatus Ventricola sp.]